MHKQIIQLRRDVTVHSRSLSIALEQARLDYAQRINAAENRFRETLQSVGDRVEIMALTRTALKESLTVQTVEKSRDNLILAMILGHVRSHPSGEAALLTGDTEFKTHAEDAGIRYFAKTEALLGWFSHR